MPFCDLRNELPQGLVFGDPDGAATYLESLRAARASQVVPYAVAPLCRVVLPNGTVLEPGQEISVELVGDGVLFLELVGQRRVITPDGD